MGYLTPPVNNVWKQTLTETAYTPDVSVQLELKNGDAIVFDLDRIAKGFVKGLYGDKIVSSCDAFISKNDDLFFIEFKNQRIANIKSKELAAKALGSLLVAQLAFFPQRSLEALSDHSHLFVVYKDQDLKGEPDYYKEIMGTFAPLANLPKEPIQFDLRRYLNCGLYHEIHTISVSHFNEFYSDLIFSNE